jgi:methyltransferase (TIGR00027 family)
MRDDTPSRTAQWVAAARGLGMLLPANVRLAEDPYGVAFSSPRIAKLLDERNPRPLASVPGLKTWIVYMQVRTRVLDDAVRTFVAGGGRQIVLLGAGFDCRALRLPELADAQVFEVDHPATQGHKLATLEKLGVTSPAQYVTWDFETRPLDELPEALADAGHESSFPTLTIWEGVTMYLTEATIDASIRAITDYSAPGSQLAMTYFAKNRLRKPSLATRVVQAAVARLGEPWTWGWTPDELPEYLEERGWELVRDVATADAARALLPANLASAIKQATDSRVALAVIPESIAIAQR